jgi:DNA-binding NarL/FixJ family response regulator
LREGLIAMLAEQKNIVVVGAAASGSEALDQIKTLQPDVALVDIGLPDKDGIEVTLSLRKNAPKVKVIILGMIDLTDEIMACIEAGAVGYVLKEASFDYLVDTIRLAERGESFCSPRMAASLFSRIAELVIDRAPEKTTPAIKLTGRELEIITLIAEGLPNKQIAQRLYIETQTVKNHIHNILDKLQLHNRLEAVQYARQQNLLK